MYPKKNTFSERTFYEKNEKPVLLMNLLGIKNREEVLIYDLYEPLRNLDLG